MIVSYNEKHFEEVSRLIKNTTAILVWGKKALETVVALDKDKVIGVGGLYSNEMHPNRSYIGIYVDPIYRRQGIGTDMFIALKQKSENNDFQATISSKNNEGTLFLESLKFQLARKCYTPELKKSTTDKWRDNTLKGISIEQVNEAVITQLASLHLDNYKAAHEAINPLNENMAARNWKDLIFQELDERHSTLLIKNNIIQAYILCYETEDKKEIEIAYIGGKDSNAVASYLPFYTEVIDQLLNQYATVRIEADDVDPFAYAALNCYEYDDSESLNAYIL